MATLAMGKREVWRKILHSRIVVFAPHPDDEVIGAFSFLSCRPANSFVIFVTDGAPLRLGPKRAALQSQRRKESECLAELLALPRTHIVRFDLSDQEASYQLPLLTQRVQTLLCEIAPDVVIIPAYEGGHPDHDSTAFAVHRAAGLLGTNAPDLVEMALYHSRDGSMATGEFLNGRISKDALTVALSLRERRLKQRAYHIYSSQAEVLKYFPISCERFRAAPRYDFLSAPHPGKLFYENFDWNVSGTGWRRLAKQAISHHEDHF
jgi:LmbE family N-acetylglucosaminyl deacetylase